MVAIATTQILAINPDAKVEKDATLATKVKCLLHKDFSDRWKMDKVELNSEN